MQFLDFFDQYIQYGFKSSDDVVDSAIKTMEINDLKERVNTLESILGLVLKAHKDGDPIPDILYVMFPIKEDPLDGE